MIRKFPRLAASILGLLGLLGSPGWASSAAAPHLDLKVQLDPVARTLSASATLDFQGPGLKLDLAPEFHPSGLKIDGRPWRLESDGTGTLKLPPVGDGKHTLQMDYQGQLAPLPVMDHRQVLGNLPPMADKFGTFLPAGSGWYPDPGIPFSYRLTLSLPPGQKGIVPGTLVTESEIAPALNKTPPKSRTTSKTKDQKTSPQTQAGYHAEYVFPQAAEGIDLLAGPYVVKERLVPRSGQGPLRLRTWFYRDMADLSEGYLEDAQRYIERYSQLIGPYPFDGFSVVAAPIPTGFGMPTLTYLGREVLRLPFIRATSLGHEVLHNWWGNGVIPDWATGNWSEGLTTFMADYAYKEDQSEEAARDARLGWLRNLAAVPEGEDMPLTQFTARHHGISSIVGYDKAAMLFFMLRDEIGREAFSQGLRLFWQRHRFQQAGWWDLEKAFAEASGRDLRTFFHQWVEQAGAPSLNLKQALWISGNLNLSLQQTAPAYTLQVPLRLLVYPNQMQSKSVNLSEAYKRYSLTTPNIVQAVDLDPEYRLWRHLDPQYFPPTLREVFVAPHVGLVLAEADGDLAQSATTLAAQLLDHPPEVMQAEHKGLPGHDPVLIMGRAESVNALLTRLGLQRPPVQVDGKGSAQVWVDRDETGRTYGVVMGRDADSLQALQRPLPHYGRQSWLVFEGAKALDKGIWPARVERVRVDVPSAPSATNLRR